MSKLLKFIDIVKEAATDQEVSSEKVTPEARYVDLGLDSMSTFTVVSETEDQLGVKLDWKDFNSGKTIEEIWSASAQK